MPIPGSVLGSWSHHHSNKASIQAHTSIRDALASYDGWAKEIKYDIFLQGSYKNDTNLRKDSDVDVVVQLAAKLSPKIAQLSGTQLVDDETHKLIYEGWRSFRSQVLKALRATYGTKTVTTGRKSIKIAKDQLHASADIVVTVHCGKGLTFYLPDEHRWVVSYPDQHHSKGLKKEEATNNRFKRTIRMFKAARNQLEDNRVIKKRGVSSYFIESLLYNVPDELFRKRLDESYCDILEFLKTAKLDRFKCQNSIHKLFAPSKDLWSQNEARKFVQTLRRLWDEWPDTV